LESVTKYSERLLAGLEHMGHQARKKEVSTEVVPKLKKLEQAAKTEEKPWSGGKLNEEQEAKKKPCRFFLGETGCKGDVAVSLDVFLTVREDAGLVEVRTIWPTLAREVSMAQRRQNLVFTKWPQRLQRRISDLHSRHRCQKRMRSNLEAEK
jgi:hypothetical protein